MLVVMKEGHVWSGTRECMIHPTRCLSTYTERLTMTTIRPWSYSGATTNVRASRLTPEASLCSEKSAAAQGLKQTYASRIICLVLRSIMPPEHEDNGGNLLVLARLAKTLNFPPLIYPDGNKKKPYNLSSPSSKRGKHSHDSIPWENCLVSVA